MLYASYAGMALLCAVIFYTDWTSRKIRNQAVIGILIIACFIKAVEGVSADTLAASIWLGISLLVLGFIGWLLKIWGGGDAKLLSALAFALTTPSSIGLFLLAATLSGGILALVCLTMKEKNVPYSIALIAGYCIAETHFLYSSV